MIITHAMRLADGTMVAKGKGISKPTHLLIDECQEIAQEEEYQKLIDSFRVKGSERKIFLLYNPSVKSHWLFLRFFNPDGSLKEKWSNDHIHIHTTYLDNKDNIDPSKALEWERLKVSDPDYYEHHIMGLWKEWGNGNVFKDWHFDRWEPDPEGEVLYGIDWGFSNDPSTCIKIIKKKKTLWLEELVYLPGLTNEDLSYLLLKKGVPTNATIFADSAEPKSIEDLKRFGFKNIKPSVKGPDSVRNGISRIREYEVYVHPDSENLKYEYMSYKYRDGTDTPIDRDNHLLDPLRYCIGSYSNKPKFGIPNLGRTRQNYED